ncbi:hypothetical protein UlMin_041417 [Ulmus minor]
MAAITALSASPFSSTTTTTSPSQTTSAKLSFPIHRTNPRIRIFCHGKLNSSDSEGGHESVDEAFFFDGDDLIDDGEESDEEDETESSIDLLIRFVQSLIKKISKRAKKASRSVLPPAISTHLVSFAVDGLLLLTSLSILKALLEVVCTLGGTVFVAILLLRVIWATLSYFQSGNNFNQGGSSFNTPQPVL